MLRAIWLSLAVIGLGALEIVLVLYTHQWLHAAVGGAVLITGIASFINARRLADRLWKAIQGPEGREVYRFVPGNDDRGD